MLETLFRHLDMVRLSAAGVLMLALVGCTGLIDGGSDGKTHQERTATEKWETGAYPVLRDNCATCHAGSRAGVEFLVGTKPTEVYASIKKYDPPVINTDAPSSSRILSKGAHDGPMLSSDQQTPILAWIQAERDAQISKPDDPTQLLATAPFAIQLCTPPALPDSAGCPTNHIPLDAISEVAMTIPGAEISFTAQALSTSIYLTNLKLNGGTAGAYLEHPLFVSIPATGDPFPDQIDRYFNVKLNAKAGASQQLSGGTALFSGFAATDMLEIHFKTLTAFKPDAGGGTTLPGGCKVVASFKTNVVPQVQANCASCHAGGNMNAKAAMDLTGYNSATDAAAVMNACNQMRTRVNLTTTDQSGIFLAPDPASNTNHPFKFAAGGFPTFKTPVDLWVQAEKTAP